MSASTDHPSASNTYFEARHTCSSSIDTGVTLLNYYVTIDLGVQAAQPGAVRIGLMLHGYTGDNDSFADVDRQRAASAIGACLTPGGRGNNGATGTRDANARSPQDLADVLADVRSRYPNLSPTICVAYGAYSGGGGDLLALLAKRPGLVAAGALYFPLVDYASWYAFNPAQAPALLDVDIGGSPAAFPLRYLARYWGKWLPFTLAWLGSATPLLWSFWDTGDAILDPQTQRDFVAACVALGVTISSVETTDGTVAHGYPQEHAGIIAQEIVYAAALRAAPALTMPTVGSLPVLGWVAWGSLSVWCGSSADPRTNDGGDRVGILVFDTVRRVYRVSPLTGPMHVDLRDGADTVRFLCNRTCIVNVAAGTVVEIDDPPAAPLLSAGAPLLAGAAPMLGTPPAFMEPWDPRTLTLVS